MLLNIETPIEVPYIDYVMNDVCKVLYEQATDYVMNDVCKVLYEQETSLKRPA